MINVSIKMHATKVYVTKQNLSVANFSDFSSILMTENCHKRDAVHINLNKSIVIRQVLKLWLKEL